MTAAQIAQSEAFHAYVAPNLWAVEAMFFIGIAGLLYVAVRCFREALISTHAPDWRDGKEIEK